MGQKTVRFSDLNGQLIMEDDSLARIVIQEHPELVDGPVEIEALTDEAKVSEIAVHLSAHHFVPHDDQRAIHRVVCGIQFSKEAVRAPAATDGGP